MPLRANRPCKHPGCRALATDGRFCRSHATQAAAVRPYDLWRGTPAERGYDADWRRVRKIALERDAYTCRECREPATDVHHKITVALAPHLRLDLDNLISLCKPCHSAITALRDSAFAGPRGQHRHRR